MKIIMIRHGETAGNLQKKYIGRTNETLCSQGTEKLLNNREIKKYPAMQKVIVSPMLRCVQTANLIYPEIPENDFIYVNDFSEIDFGDFEDKSYDQLKDIPSYKSWLESNGTLPFPNGESREKFIERTFSAYKKVSSQLEALHINQAVFVVHGGTIMAVLSSILNEPYFNFQIPNCEGYSFEQTFAENQIKIENLRRL